MGVTPTAKIMKKFNLGIMKYNPNIHHRRSIRLKNHNYSQAGMYFITIGTQNRFHLFGKIVNGKMVLDNAGQ